MKEYQARNEGLEFTGIYEWAYEKDFLKDRAKKIRKEYGTRAILVPDDDGRGLSIYAGPEYFKEKEIKKLEAEIAQFDANRAQVEKEYRIKVQRLNEQHAMTLMRLENANS